MRAIWLAWFALAPLAANAQSLEAGKKAFQVCAVCHDVGEAARSKVGPPLNGLFGRKAGSVAGFAYSNALRASGIVWDDANFRQFLANPRAFLPGNRMTFAGTRSDQEAADLAAYLKSFDAEGKGGVVTAAALSTAQDVQPDSATVACIQSFGSAAEGEKCAAAGGPLLQAIGVLIAGYPASGYGRWDAGALVDRDSSGPLKFYSRLKAAEPCLVETLEFSQDHKPGSAQVVLTTLDFRKITDVGYFLNDINAPPGKPVAIDDPGMNAIVLKGEDWVCRESVTLDPESAPKPRACEKALTVFAYGADNRAAVLAALSVVHRTCGRSP